MPKLLMIVALTLAFLIPAIAKAQSPDLSGIWYLVDLNGPDNGPVTCVPSQDMEHLVAINNGVNAVHIYADKSGRATKVVFGDDALALATGYTRSAAACAANYATAMQKMTRDTSTVTVEPDSSN